MLIGSGEIYYDGKAKAWMFGYNLHHNFWNCGYATEEAKSRIQFAYSILNARYFISELTVNNPASGRAMEKIWKNAD